MTTKRKPATKAAPIINIEGAPKESVTEARAANMDILRCKDVNNQTKRAALEVFGELCSINNVSIQNCQFNTGDRDK